MTTVGKLLVVLHLLLSVLFMAFAGAVFTSQTNWRTKALAQMKLVEDANGKLRNQQAEFEKERGVLNASVVEKTNEINKLTGEKTSLAEQNTALEADNKRLMVSLDAQKDIAIQNTAEADDRKQEADTQRGVNETLYKTREELLKALSKVNDEKFALELDLQQIKERHEQLVADLATFKKFLSSKDLPTDPKLMAAQVIPPPPLKGEITDYRKDAKSGIEYVEISLGSDEDLVVGHKMTAFSDDKGYLGQIRLQTVYPDKSVGIVLKEEKAKNVTIKKGDHVTTKF